MKRVLSVFLGVLLLAAPSFAQAAKAGKMDKMDKPAASKTLSAAGKVSAVTADSVTVKGKDGEWTFAVDKGTTVVAAGGSHKMAALNADKKPTMVTEFVKSGDDVTVKYHDMGATKHAATISVHSAAKK
jgi:uncharacterized protein YfiM (DUF2279 family)